MTSAFTTAFKCHPDSGNWNPCLSVKTNMRRFSGTSPSSQTEILYPVVQDKGNRRLYLVEMAVAWDSILAERRAENLFKYDDLCADLRRQYPGHQLYKVLVVIGRLGTVTHQLMSDLGHLPTTEKTETEIEGMQCSVLCSAVRILRGHLPVSELMASALSGSVVSHQPARTASSLN